MTVVIGVVFDVSNESVGVGMRYEVMTGVERRRRWSEEEKLSVLGEVGVEGETVASVARRHDITRQHIYQWRREMRSKGLLQPREPVLLPVEVSDDVRSGDDGAPSRDHVELVLANGRSLRARATMSDVHWIRLIRIAEAA
jgi:transposase